MAEQNMASFYIDTFSDNSESDILKNLSHPFVLSVVTAMHTVFTKKQLDDLHNYANLIWDKFNDSDEDKALMNEIPGGEELLHVLINMKDFVKTFEMIKSVGFAIEKLNQDQPQLDTIHDSNTAKRARNDLY